MKFESLGLKHSILKALQEQGYANPTPIQEQAIPAALAGRDVLGCARTGTGKTCAFAAPILQRLSAQQKKGRPIRALILTPTRELAIQIQECFEAYGKYLPLKSVVIFGGVGQGPQVDAIRSGCDILVATPGRLKDLHDQGLLLLDRLEILVLDEADRMLDMGFIHDVRQILKWLPAQKQTLFFSATMPDEISDLVNSLLQDPVRIAVDPVSSPVDVIDQSVYFVDKGNKTKLLVHLLNEKQIPSALVFTRTKHGANKVAQDLEKAGVTAAAIHGNKSQTARQAALSGFKSGSVRVLVATDIAARGLDIDSLACVFNYNLPEVPETYVHRIGRTGRAGKDGIAITLCDYSEKSLLRDIEKLIGRKVPVVDGHPYPMQNFELPVKDARGRVVNPEDAEARAAAKARKAARRKEASAPEKAAAPAPAPVIETPAAEPAKRSGRQKKASTPEKAAAPAPAPIIETPVPAAEPAKKSGRRKGKKSSAAQSVSVLLTPSAPVEEEKEEVSFSEIKLPEARKYKRPERRPLSALDEIAPALSPEEVPVSQYGVKRTGRLRNTFLSPEEHARYNGSDAPLEDATARLFATRKAIPERYRDADPRSTAAPDPSPAEPAKKKAKKKQTAAPASSAAAEPAEVPAAGAKARGRKAKSGTTQQAAALKTQTDNAPKAAKTRKKSASAPAARPAESAPSAKPKDNTPKKANARKKSASASAARPTKKEPTPENVIPSAPAPSSAHSAADAPKAGRSRKRAQRPPQDQRSIYGAHKKDSTEQPGSLMKPYYLSDD